MLIDQYCFVACQGAFELYFNHRYCTDIVGQYLSSLTGLSLSQSPLLRVQALWMAHTPSRSLQRAAIASSAAHPAAGSTGTKPHSEATCQHGWRWGLPSSSLSTQEEACSAAWKTRIAIVERPSAPLFQRFTRLVPRVMNICTGPCKLCWLLWTLVYDCGL